MLSLCLGRGLEPQAQEGKETDGSDGVNMSFVVRFLVASDGGWLSLACGVTEGW
jgi:hypothetical protein